MMEKGLSKPRQGLRYFVTCHLELFCLTSEFLLSKRAILGKHSFERQHLMAQLSSGVFSSTNLYLAFRPSHSIPSRAAPSILAPGYARGFGRTKGRKQAWDCRAERSCCLLDLLLPAAHADLVHSISSPSCHSSLQH